MKNIVLFISILLVLFFSVDLAKAAVFESNQSSYSLDKPILDDLFVGSQTVSIDSPVEGELFASGRIVDIRSRIARSIFAAGDTVSINDGAGYNIFAAGNTITIKGTVEHDIYIAGSTITIDPSAHIKGNLRIAGSKANLGGKIDGSVYFAGDEMTSNAAINGDLKAQVNQLTFTGGSIAQDLKYKSNKDAIGLDKINITGVTIREPQETNRKSRIFQSWLFGFLTTFVSGAALILLMPKKIKEVVEQIRANWGKSFLYGVAVMIITPILSMLLFASIVAWPIALIILLLYGIVLYESFIIAQIALGDFILSRVRNDRKNWWLALAVGTITTSLVMSLPILRPIGGMLLYFGIMIPLSGAIIIWAREKFI
jgi:cytoskeletal protein CcmA (bactofilin family)